MSQELLLNLKISDVGWTSTVYGYTLLDNAGAYCPVRQKGNKLPTTANIILFLSEVHRHVIITEHF